MKKNITTYLAILTIIAASLYVVQVYAEDNTSIIAAKYIKQVTIMNSIKLDTSIFRNDKFTSLKDFSKPLPEEPIGRNNPFAPLP